MADKQSRAWIEDKFETGDVPTQEQYYDAWFSHIHKDEIPSETFTNVSSNYIEVTNFTLPSAALGRAEIERKLHVFVGKGRGFRLFYNVNSGYRLNAGQNRIEFKAHDGAGLEALRNEDVVVLYFDI